MADKAPTSTKTTRKISAQMRIIVKNVVLFKPHEMETFKHMLKERGVTL